MSNNNRRQPTPDVLGELLHTDPERLAAIDAENRKRRRSRQRDRSWDKRHKPQSYRIDPAIHENIKVIVAEVNEHTGFRTTISEVVTSLLEHAIEDYYRGNVQIGGWQLRRVSVNSGADGPDARKT